MLRFDGRVVVVTGAGGGLGRTYALLFAERGASVVVNDLGGNMAGGGKTSVMADAVVTEIKSKGGKAVANYDSVEEGEKIIATAIDNFGRVDIVINNAGVLRDKSFVKMTDNDWDLIYKVHLRGAYSVCKAAWPHMRKHNYGRIIVTSSTSGVYGNFGQANYSAAKLGLIGLCNTLAREGGKYNIICNSLVPTAGSRLTQDVMPAEVHEALKPDYVAPLVVWLCHETNTCNGGVYEAAGGWYGQLQWYRSQGKALRKGNINATPEDVRDSWEEITNMNGSRHFADSVEVTGHVMDVVEQINNSDNPRKSEPIKQYEGKTNPDLAKSYKFQDDLFSYTSRDAIIYALGAGAGAKDLDFVYENSENFTVLPTFCVVPGLRCTSSIADVSGLNVDLTKLLHGEQYIEFKNQWPADGTVTSKTKIVDVLDKKSGAVVLINVDTYDVSNTLLSTAQYSIFLRGAGNFGGAKNSDAEINTKPIPNGPPDHKVEQVTSVDQAVLYRMGSLDYNPLHLDPEFAKLSGFKQPILHGLCSLGFSVRHVLDKYADNDAKRLKSVKVRFAKPVIPGQTLVTEMWKRGDTVHFQTKVKENNEIVLSNSYLTMTAADGKPSEKNQSETSLKSEAVFKELENRLIAQPDLVKKVNAIFLWVINKDGKEAKRWTVDLKSSKGSIYPGEPTGAKPGATLTLDDDVMVKLVSGKLNPQQAFMSGKLKIKGNIMLTQKLQSLLANQAKL